MKCTFCEKNISTGKGKIFVRSDGRALNFCSNKCEKNMLKLKRNPRTTRWTGLFQRTKKEEKAPKKN